MGRKYDKCQKCGGAFTDEHHFSKYCKKCKAEIEQQVEVEVVKETEVTKDLTPFDLSADHYEIRHKDITMGIRCPECGREIDVRPGLQAWEIKCDYCKLLFTIETNVRVSRFA